MDSSAKLLHIGVIALFLFSLPHEVRGQSTYYAGNINSPLQLNCSSSQAFTQLSWSYRNQTGSPIPFCQVESTGNWNFFDSTNFRQAPNNSLNEYNIEVNSLTPTLSTSYECMMTMTAAPPVTQQLWVIGLDPLQCPLTVNPIQTYNEGDTVPLECTSNYYQYTRNTVDSRIPTMTWSNSVDGVMSSNASESIRQKILYSNVTLTAALDNVPIWCNLTFGASQGFNEPYYQECYTTYYVRHNVSTINFDFYSNGSDSSNDVVYVGTTINCTANGRPEPVITWLDQDGNEVASTGYLLITEAMSTMSQPLNYTCRATNNPSGTSVIVVEQSLSFYVGDGGTVVQATGGVEAWVIAVAVVVPLVVIIAAAIGGYFFYKHRKDKKKKKSTTSSRHDSNPVYTPVATQPSMYADQVRAAPTNGQPTALPYVVPRDTTPVPGSGTHSPSGAGGFGALGVQYYTGSNQNLNSSINSLTPANKPAYPYNPRNGTTPTVSMNPNPGVRPPPGNPPYPYPGPNRQPSVASSVTSSRSSYHGAPAPGGMAPYPGARSVHSSMDGSEV